MVLSQPVDLRAHQVGHFESLQSYLLYAEKYVLKEPPTIHLNSGGEHNCLPVFQGKEEQAYLIAPLVIHTLDAQKMTWGSH